jgi:acyl carrier protein
MNTPATGLRGYELVRGQIHEFIALNFLFDGTSGSFHDDLPLVERGILDQTGVLELALFLEETYGIQVDEADLIPENFDTVNNIARYTLLRLANA